MCILFEKHRDVSLNFKQLKAHDTEKADYIENRFFLIQFRQKQKNVAAYNLAIYLAIYLMLPLIAKIKICKNKNFIYWFNIDY